MFQSLGRFVIRWRFLVVAMWLAVAAGTFLLAPSLADVGSADETSFLPADAESMRARDVLERAFPDEAAAGTGTIVVVRDTGLTDADRGWIGDLEAWLVSSSAPESVRRVVDRVQSAEGQPELASMFVSADGQAELLQLQMNVAAFQTSANEAVDAIRAHMASTLPAGLDAHLSGGAGIGRDYLTSIVEGTDRTTLVTIVLVIAILLLIYRAPIAALVPLLTIGAAFVTARGLLGFLAEAGWQLPSLMDSFIVVLVFGVGTDYTIFLISRFREELGRNEMRRAGVVTVGRIGAVITASAATVVVGLSAMAVGRFGLINTMGPGLALAIVVTLLAGLTLAPALLAIAGHWLFWPLHEAVRAPAGASDEPPAIGVWGTIARWITTRPGLVATAVLVVLAIPLLGLARLNSSFDVLNELPTSSDSRIGFDLVAEHFDRGRLLQTSVLLEATDTDLSSPAGLAMLARATDRIAGLEGVESVRSLVDPDASGATPDAFRPSSRLAEMASSFTLSTDPAEALANLLKPETREGVESASAYLSGLATAFPDLAADPSLTGAQADFQSLGRAIKLISAAPPTPGSPEAALLAQQLGQVGPRLPAELSALSATFGTRSDDLYIPPGLAGGEGEQLARMTAAYLSPKRDVSRVFVTMTDDPYAPGAFATARRIRDAVASPDVAGDLSLQTYVGGPTAEFADVQSTINTDFQRVAVITVLGIFLVLVLLLRSLVAPIYLVLSVLLSYATTLGLSAIIFQDALGQPGLNYFIPLIVFVLLVALGSDYNIFLMSRVREESATRELRAGIRVASIRTGTVITSAGIILAGTFAALVTGQLQILFQAGVTVALGVLIDTFLVRSLLIPAVTVLFGEAAWWPFGRTRMPTARPPTAAPQPSP